MKRPTTLLSLILTNVGMQCSLAVERDLQVIEDRFEHEGMSFLTITLPVLCDALDQGLACGRISPRLFPGFKTGRRSGSLPAFMQGFFMRVFKTDGSLLDEPCIDAIRAIRQVSRTFKKVKLPCTAARQKQAFERYSSNDENVFGHSSYIFSDDALFDIVSSYLWSDLEGLSGELYCSPGVFGSGATAERSKYHERHSVRAWPERGEELFPLAFHTSHAEDDRDSFAGVELISEHDEQPVRVVSVPKTLKTPRIISVEPSYMMLRQQSIAKPLMDWLEDGHLGFKSIRFRDQSHNREMARLGSIDGSYSTIDLKDASDLVSNDLVKRIFRTCPSFLDYIQAARSTRAKLPDGRIISLKKYASMGSALCFPIEAMVFFTIAAYSAIKQTGRRPSRSLLTEISAKISVYGDDIIVPTETAVQLMDDLELFGLKVNHDKSMSQGLFRESCGGDYYGGHDVTPTYVRLLASGQHLSGHELAAYVSLSNQFYMKGLWHACQKLRDWVEERYRRPLARTTCPVGVLTWASILYDTQLRWDSDRHAYRVRGPSLRPQRHEDPVQDVRAGMLVCFGSGFAQESRATFAQALRARSTGYSLSKHLPSGEGLASVQSWADDRPIQVGHVGFALGQRNPGTSGKSILEQSISQAQDLCTSVRPYSLKAKSKWSPVFSGLSSW